MKKQINLKLYKNNNLEKEYQNISCIQKDNKYQFILDDTKTELSSSEFIRETNSYKFVLNIPKKESYIILKEKKLTFPLVVKEVRYIENPNICLEYKINSDDEKFKIIIE